MSYHPEDFFVYLFNPDLGVDLGVDDLQPIVPRLLRAGRAGI